MIFKLAHHERLVQGCPQLELFGRFEQKTEIISRAYDFLALSLVVEGNGFLTYGGKRYELQAPCAFMVYPHLYYHYGPHTAWDETFYTFKADIPAELLYRRLGLEPIRIFWPIRRPHRIRQIINLSLELCNEPLSPAFADQLDRLAELALIESLWGHEESRLSAESQIVRKAEQYIRQNYRRPIAMADLLSICFCSARTFRRFWGRYYTIPPIKLVNKLRIDEAADLLVETDLRISEIAYKVGFENPLYFSRVFSRIKGEAPRYYRLRRRKALR